MIRRLAALVALLGLSACVSVPQPHTPAVEFVVIGDTPYDAADQAMLDQAVPVIRDLNPPFVLHLGDIQSGGEMCGPPDDRFAALIAALAPLPVVYTPGDNEWTDCDRKTDPATGRLFSELDRLEVLRRRFFSGPGLPLQEYVRQPGQPENARFVHAGLVWVTLHLTGANNGRDKVMGDDLALAARAAEARDLANTGWLNEAFAIAAHENAAGVVVIMQADMVTEVDPAALDHPCFDAVADSARLCDGYYPVRQMLPALAKNSGRPVFLIHGDTGPFRVIHRADGIWQLNAAGDTWTTAEGQLCGVRDVTLVRIDLSAPQPLQARGLVAGEVPGSGQPSASDCK